MTTLMVPSSASNILSSWSAPAPANAGLARAAQGAVLSARAGAWALSARRSTYLGVGQATTSGNSAHPNVHSRYAAPRVLPCACAAAPAAPGLPKSWLSWEPGRHLNRAASG